MKRTLALGALIAALLVPGCGVLLPKKVEFFQDKVKAVPEAKASEKETLRQAAKLAAQKARETQAAALAEGSSTNVVTPAGETARLTESVSTAVGPPLSPSGLTPEQLSAKLDTAVAALSKRLDSFKEDNNENAGKKIENTGLFQMGYFSMWALILGGLALVWAGLKIYGMINPVVGVGVNTVGRVSSAVLKKGFQEVLEGGNWFKEYLQETKKEVLSREEVLDMFTRAQVEAQSRDTQNIVETLTKD